MGGFRYSAVLGAALLAIPIATASAADRLAPPPYIPPPVDVGQTWYLRGHIGVAAQDFKGLEHRDFSDPAYFEWRDSGGFAAAPTVGVGVGFTHGDHWRFDLTGEYRGRSAFAALGRYATNDEADIGGPVWDGDDNLWGTNDYSGFKSEWLLLANAYYDLGTWRGVTPYVGAGLGLSRNTITGFRDFNVQTGEGASAVSGHQWSFAWAVHAGASVQVTDSLSLDLGYSYLNLGDARTGVFQDDGGCQSEPCVPMKFKGIASHDLKVGMRWALDNGGDAPAR